MKLSQILAEASKSETDEYTIELAFVGPKNGGSTRHFGEYVLPNGYYTINPQLLDNPEYYDRCKILVISDLVKDERTKKTHELLQRLKPTFKKYRSAHAELIFKYTVEHQSETLYHHWKGEKIPNVPGEEHTESNIEKDNVYLVLYNDKGGKTKTWYLQDQHAHALFDLFKEEIKYFS